jgi:hypothetical protein
MVVVLAGKEAKVLQNQMASGLFVGSAKTR